MPFYKKAIIAKFKNFETSAEDLSFEPSKDYTMDLKDKVFVVTGSGSGIGRACAIQLAQQGGKVVISDVNDEGGAETLAMIQDQGGEAIYQHADVAKHEDVKALFQTTLATYGRLDGLVNNAGIGGGLHFLHEYPEEEYHKIQRVNQDGVFFCSKEALGILMEQKEGGTIVNVSSVAGLAAAPRMGAYAMSKHAVAGLTKAMAAEYGKYNIRTNAICPTVIETPMANDFIRYGGEAVEMIKHTIPMKRYGQANEVADVIVWLSSSASSYVNGETIRIDGGMRA